MSSLVAADGKTITQTLAALRAVVGEAGDQGIKAIAAASRDIVAEEGALYYIRARKTRKPIRLGAKTAKTTAGRTTIEGVPAGFWSIVEKGSTRTWRIERKLLGKGKFNRRAQLLGRKGVFGPRPYVIRHGQRPVGAPWVLAMAGVDHMPGSVYVPPIGKVFEKAWHG